MFFYRDATRKHVLTQLIQAAVIMVPHVSQGLGHFFADLSERIAFEEVEAQDFTLVLR